jgi:outer membrane protein
MHGTLSAQVNDTVYYTGTVRMDLAAAIAYAKQHNLQVSISRLDQRLSEQDLLLAKAARFPDLSGNASQSVTHSKNTNPVVGGFQTQSKLQGNYSMNSSWILYRGGYVRNDIRSRELQLQTAQLNSDVIENNITLQLTTAYLDILLAGENIVYIQELVNSSRTQYDIGNTKFNAGAISKKELLQLQGQFAGDQYNLVTAQNQYRQNVLALKQLLQLPTTTNFEPVLPDTLVVEQVIPSLLGAQQLALQNRPEIKYGQLQGELADIELQKARAGYKPVISAGGSVSTGYSDNRDEKYFTQVGNNLFERFNVTLSIPIFDNRATRTSVERSKILIEQAHMQLDQAKATLNQQVEQAYIAVLNANAQYRAAETEWRANKEAYDISLTQARLGAINTVELSVQRSLYIQALQNYIQAKYNSVLNTRIYQFYMGYPISL